MGEPTPAQPDIDVRERVRDFVYDCTKDEFNTGWTLSAHQADDLIKLVRKGKAATALETLEARVKVLEGLLRRGTADLSPAERKLWKGKARAALLKQLSGDGS